MSIITITMHVSVDALYVDVWRANRGIDFVLFSCTNFHLFSYLFNN